VSATTTPYLAPGLAAPRPNDLDSAFWAAAAEERLELQRCDSCQRFQWGPELICHRCHSFELGYAEVEPTGVIYSWERVWHPVHPALNGQGPYLVVLVELPQADNVRMVGNLLGDPNQHVAIGAEVEATFEHHPDAEPPYTLVQWQVVG